MIHKSIYRLSITMALILVFASTAFAQYSDVPQGKYYTNAVNNLSAMGIINGYEDGTFKPSNYVTRAQFVKMVITALGKDDEAGVIKNATAFADVSSKHWAGGYINAGIKNNIITGYADGTFKPDENVNFAQTVTVLLRALGYSSDEMTGVWPQNYIEKAKTLDITKAISLNPADRVNRADLAVMLERTLNTDISAGGQTLAQQSKLGTPKTCIITNSSDIDNTLPSNTVKTDVGDFKAKAFNGLDYIGKEVKLLVSSNNEILSVQSIEKESHSMFVDSIAGNRISYADKNGIGIMEISDNLNFYYNGQKQAFKDIKQNVSTGCIIALALTKADTQMYECGVLIAHPFSQFVVAANDVNISDKSIGEIDISNRDEFTIIKDGDKAAFSDIKMYDVVYLIENPFKANQKILLVYDDKTTGTYEEALPNKNAVNKIKVLGKELEIETSFAASKLKSTFDIGDEITVLLGESGKIVDVVAPDSTDTSNIAVVVNARKTILNQDDSTSEQVYYVKLYKTDGTVAEYKVDDDQSFRKGKAVRFDIKDETAKLTSITPNLIYGRIDKGDRKIDDKWLSQSAVILDVHNSFGSQDIQVKKLNWQDMPSCELTQDKVIHTETGGAFGDIQLLVLDNFTEEGQFGVLMEKSEKQTSASYTLMINGQQEAFNNSGIIFDVRKGDCIYIEKDEDGLKKIRTLDSKDSAGEIQAVDSRRIKINNRVYKLANDVQIYDMKNNSPVLMSVNDLTAGKVSYVVLYSGIQSGTKDLIKIIEIKR